MGIKLYTLGHGMSACLDAVRVKKGRNEPRAGEGVAILVVATETLID